MYVFVGFEFEFVTNRIWWDLSFEILTLSNLIKYRYSIANSQIDQRLTREVLDAQHSAPAIVLRVVLTAVLT